MNFSGECLFGYLLFLGFILQLLVLLIIDDEAYDLLWDFKHFQIFNYLCFRDHIINSYHDNNFSSFLSLSPLECVESIYHKSSVLLLSIQVSNYFNPYKFSTKVWVIANLLKSPRLSIYGCIKGIFLLKVYFILTSEKNYGFHYIVNNIIIHK